MNILAIGSKITLRKICEEISDKVDRINLLDTNKNNFLNWKLTTTKKVNFYSGDIKKIDTLIGAGLESSPKRANPIWRHGCYYYSSQGFIGLRMD